MNNEYFNNSTTKGFGIFLLILSIISFATCVFVIYNKTKITTTDDIEISNQTNVINLNEEEYLPKYTPREELPQYSNV